MDACGGLDDWLGETEPEPESESELEPKNELPSAASWLIREESSRAPLAADEAGVEVVAALPVMGAAADEQREDAEAGHRHARRCGLEQASASAGGSQARG